jgi:hypothetical protein
VVVGVVDTLERRVFLLVAVVLVGIAQVQHLNLVLVLRTQ